MSQSAFETVNHILDIWKAALQAIMFLVLCQWMECGI